MWPRLSGAIILLTMEMAMNCGAGATPIYQDHLNLLTVLDEQGQARTVTTPEQRAVRRKHILEAMQLAMGPLPAKTAEIVTLVNSACTARGPKFTSYRVDFASPDGDLVPAYLFIPTGLKGKAPGMLCLHQTTGIGKSEPAGLGGLPNLHYAKELAERGYVTLAPDYPGYGDYQCDPYAMGYVSATMKGIVNHRRALDVLQSLPEVDPERLGCIGHSLGGHNTLFLAAFDERVKVAVTSCGFNSFRKYMGGDVSGWSHKGYMPRIKELYDAKGDKMPFDFSEIVAAVAPRAVFTNSPLKDSNFAVEGVYDCLRAAQPVFDLLGAGDKLQAVHPDCEHDFPVEAREAAYEFVGKVLKP